MSKLCKYGLLERPKFQRIMNKTDIIYTHLHRRITRVYIPTSNVDKSKSDSLPVFLAFKIMKDDVFKRNDPIYSPNYTLDRAEMPFASEFERFHNKKACLRMHNSLKCE